MGFRLFENRRADTSQRYPFGDILSLAAAVQARDVIRSFAGYAPTPLRDLARAANTAGVGQVLYKDESARFELGSFKALGAPYALVRLLREKLEAQLCRPVAVAELLSGKLHSLLRNCTVTCATDGNHGRALAAAARATGCQCVVFLHKDVSPGREDSIAALGARTIRVNGDYDNAVRAADEAARTEGWELISDTSWPGYERIPVDVMQGYAVVLIESLEQLHSRAEPLPTHVFVQGGVGGIAAATCAHLWETMWPNVPTIVVVEPEEADCLLQSALAGRASKCSGTLETAMAGLSCGEASFVAWPILQGGVRFFMTIPDAPAIEAMRLLAHRGACDDSIVAGESATAGLAALLLTAAEPEARQTLGLGPRSVVLAIGTEGATDPALYRKLVGKHPFQVAAAPG